MVDSNIIIISIVISMMAQMTAKEIPQKQLYHKNSIAFIIDKDFDNNTGNQNVPNNTSNHILSQHNQSNYKIIGGPTLQLSQISGSECTSDEIDQIKCLNNGVCIINILAGLRSTGCRCQSGFVGKKCEQQATQDFGYLQAEMMAGVGAGIALLVVVIVIIIFLVCLLRQKRKKKLAMTMRPNETTTLNPASDP